MESLASLTLLLAVLIIVSRGALLVAPQATVRAFRRLLEYPSRLRLMGLLFALLGVGFVQSAPQAALHQPTASTALTVVGWGILVAAAWLVLWPRGYQRLAEPVLDAVSDSSVLRVLGGLGVLFGLGVAWLAFQLR